MTSKIFNFQAALKSKQAKQPIKAERRTCVNLGAVADAKKKGEGLNTTIICQHQQLTQMDPPPRE